MRKLLGSMALIAAMATPGLADAQSTVVGALGAYHTDLEAVGIGAYASFAVPDLHENISINPSFVYYFPDVGDAFEVNGDVVYRFPVENASIIPVAFAGLNIFRVSFSSGGFSASNTDIGLNLGGAVIFPLESVRPIAGAKFEIQDGTGFVIFGGAGIAVGG